MFDVFAQYGSGRPTPRPINPETGRLACFARHTSHFGQADERARKVVIGIESQYYAIDADFGASGAMRLLLNNAETEELIAALRRAQTLRAQAGTHGIEVVHLTVEDAGDAGTAGGAPS